MRRKSQFLKKRKKIYHFSFFWYSIFTFLIFYFFYLFIFVYPIFLIKNFEVESKNPFLAKKVFLFLKPQNILFFNEKKIKKEIMSQFLEIKDVLLKKKFSDKIEVKVEERKEFLEFCFKSCFVSDDEGFLFSQKPQTQIPKVFVDKDLFLGSVIFSKREILNIFQIIEHLKKREISFEEIKIENGNLIFKNSHGFSLIFDPQKDFQWQIKKLFTFLDKTENKEDLEKIKIIDLRFGNFVNFQYY